MALVLDLARPGEGQMPTRGQNVDIRVSDTEGHIETWDTDGSVNNPTLTRMSPIDHNTHETGDDAFNWIPFSLNNPNFVNGVTDWNATNWIGSTDVDIGGEAKSMPVIGTTSTLQQDFGNWNSNWQVRVQFQVQMIGNTGLIVYLTDFGGAPSASIPGSPVLVNSDENVPSVGSWQDVTIWFYPLSPPISGGVLFSAIGPTDTGTIYVDTVSVAQRDIVQE